MLFMTKCKMAIVKSKKKNGASESGYENCRYNYEKLIMKIIRYMYIVYNTLEVCKSICFLQTYLVTWNAIYFRKSIAFVCNGETWTYLKIASHVICGRYWFRGRIIATGSKMRAFYVKQRHLCKFPHFSCSTTNQF